MESRRRLFLAITLLLVLMLVLVACERPVPSSNGSDTGTTDTGGVADNDSPSTVDTTTDIDAETETQTDTDSDAGSSDVEVTDEAAETPVPVESTAESGEDNTPRVEEEAATEEESSTPEDSDAAAEIETSEASDKEDKADESETTTTEETTVETVAEQPVESAEIETTAATTHIVAPGENLYRIGLLYNVSWVTLAELNGVSNANQIVVGQVLEIPGDPPAGPEPTPSPLTETTYTVQVNDNLFTIGLAYGISWVQIAEANGIVNPNQIFVGQVLKIPVDAPGPAPQFTHRVVTGETLFLIALRYGVAWPVIAEANDLGSPYVIYVGQTLVIPGGQ